MHLYYFTEYAAFLIASSTNLKTQAEDMMIGY